MIVERVAGQDHDIGAEIARRLQHAAQPGRAVAAMHRRDAVVIDMQVGGMDEEDVCRGAFGVKWHERIYFDFVMVIPAKAGIHCVQPHRSGCQRGSRPSPG